MKLRTKVAVIAAAIILTIAGFVTQRPIGHLAQDAKPSGFEGEKPAPRHAQPARSKLPAATSLAGYNYEMWQFRNGQICVKTGGSTYWPMPSATAGWNASDINVTYNDTCSNYDRAHTVVVAAYNDPNENACAKTASLNNDYSWEYVTYNGVKVARWVPNQMVVWLNHADNLIAGCRNTVAMRQHLLSHELGHAFGMAHNTLTDSVMSTTNGWDFSLPTATDVEAANERY